MIEPVTIEFRYEEREILRAHRLNARAWFGFVGGVLAVLVVIEVAVSRGSDHVFATAFGAMIVTLALIIAAYAWWTLYLNPRRALRSNPSTLALHAMTFSETGLAYKAQGIDATMDWKQFVRARRVDFGWLLYQPDQHYTLVPTRAFANADDRARFEALVSAHVAKIERG
jgi:hypothetical protein